MQAASLGGIEGDLGEVRRGLKEVEGGVSRYLRSLPTRIMTKTDAVLRCLYRLKRKIATPHEALSSSLLLMTRLRRAASLARRAQRFVVLARRLEGQMGEIDGSFQENGLRSSVGVSEGERGTERRERAMAEAALTLAEIGEWL